MHCSSWTPEPEVADHTGRSISSDDDFFVPPPPEIGTIITARTNLKQTQQPTLFAARRIRNTLLTGLVCTTLAWVVVLADARPSYAMGIWLVAIRWIGLVMLLAWLHEKQHYTCSYAGTQGVARFSCYGNRTRITRSSVLRFETAVNLRAAERRLFLNGAYVNTWYSIRWFDLQGRQVYRMTGTHHSQDDTPSPDDLYCLARVAEALWARHMWPTVKSSIEHGGTWRFNAGDRRYVEVGADYVECSGKRISYDDLDLQTERGFIVFRRKGEKKRWHRLDNVPRAKYAQLDNALVLLWVVEWASGKHVDTSQVASEGRYHALLHTFS